MTARGLRKGSTQADDGRLPAALVVCEVSSRAGVGDQPSLAGRTHNPPEDQIDRCLAVLPQQPEALHGRDRRRRDESHTTWKRADEPEKDAARSADRPRGQKSRNEKTKEARNKKDQQSKKERIEPPPLRKNKDKDVRPNQEIPRRATEFHQMRPAESSKVLRLLALRPRTNNRRLYGTFTSMRRT